MDDAQDDIPLVSVCVQGGPGTVKTVLDAVISTHASLAKAQ